MSPKKSYKCPINMIRWSTSLIITETQIKTTMRYHFTSVKMAIIKKSTNNKCRRGCWKKGILLHCLGECKVIQLLWSKIWRILKKLTVSLPYDPATAIYFSRESSRPRNQTQVSHIAGRCFPDWATQEVHDWAYSRENHNWKRHTYPNVHSSTVYNRQDMEIT